jgi:hypothetical protein
VSRDAGDPRPRTRRSLGGGSPLTRWAAAAAIVIASAAATTGTLGLLFGGGDEAAPTPTATAPSPGATPSAGSGGTAPGTLASRAAPTLTPDLPDLSLDAVFSRDNQLVVVIANRGAGTFEGELLVTVDGRSPHRLDPGAPLQPGAVIERPVEGEYVQRRASVTVEIEPAVPVPEESLENNRRTVTVTPDQPNDLVLTEAAVDESGTQLRATVRNDSPIPVVGVVTVAVRRTAPRNELLGRTIAAIELEPSAETTVEVALTAPGGEPPDPPPTLGELLVILSATEVIQDANPLNDVLPRAP